MTADQKARIDAAHAEARKAREENRCPVCGRPVVRNLAITGWVQCSQFGAVGFRKDPAAPSCNWQGFTC